MKRYERPAGMAEPPEHKYNEYTIGGLNVTVSPLLTPLSMNKDFGYVTLPSASTSDKELIHFLVRQKLSAMNVEYRQDPQTEEFQRLRASVFDMPEPLEKGKQPPIPFSLQLLCEACKTLQTEIPGPAALDQCRRQMEQATAHQRP